MPLQLEVVTIERRVYSADDVDMVIAPGSEGVMGILPRHEPIITGLKEGELEIIRGETREILAIGGGFMEVRANQVVVMAVVADRITVTAVVVVHPAKHAHLGEEIERPEDGGAAQRGIDRVNPATDVVRGEDGIAVRDGFDDGSPARGQGVPLYIQQSAYSFATSAHPPFSSGKSLAWKLADLSLSCEWQHR